MTTTIKQAQHNVRQALAPVCAATPAPRSRSRALHAGGPVAVVLAAMLAATVLGGCAASASDTSAASGDETATSSASSDAQGVALGTDGASGQDASADAGTSSDADTSDAASSEPSSGSDQDSPAANNAEVQQPQQGGFGAGMGAMDLQPGQTNDKGYTATDSGIAISATLNVADAFTDRDLQQEADTQSAQTITLENGTDTTISQEGVYVVNGTATDATIVVEAPDTAKVQLVLNGVSITNTGFPAIYVKSADKVFVTLVGQNSLAVTGEFAADGETNTDAAIFSKDDLCLNGTGSLAITSTDHAIVSKDDLKVTGGTYTIDAAGSGLRANDSVRIAGGSFTINAEDAIKAKNDDDNELGYVYIQDGTFAIKTADNGIQGYAFVQIDGGTFDIASEECIEGTYIQINGGSLTLDSSDDGINASVKSSVYTPTIEITGGTIGITMAQGDTDALDSNGYIYIKGGKIDISAQSAFDYAWGAEMTGGDVTVNGQQVTEITESMMGGMGGPGGGMGGMGGHGGPGMGGQRPDSMGDGQMPEGMDPPADAGQGRPGRPGGMGGQMPQDGMDQGSGDTMEPQA